jgi:repressor of nif and glnA expression
MVQSANSDTEKKILSILRVLSESSGPLGSITIARELQRYGVDLSERAIRYHLRIMDERGYCTGSISNARNCPRFRGFDMVYTTRTFN